jgi:hypothetical protein
LLWNFGSSWDKQSNISNFRCLCIILDYLFPISYAIYTTQSLSKFFPSTLSSFSLPFTTFSLVYFNFSQSFKFLVELVECYIPYNLVHNNNKSTWICFNTIWFWNIMDVHCWSVI